MKLDAALIVSVNLIEAGIKISQMVQAGIAAGQSHISDTDWAQILADDKAARDAVVKDLG